jgi:hypothetical protein
MENCDYDWLERIFAYFRQRFILKALHHCIMSCGVVLAMPPEDTGFSNAVTIIS